jgi:hypothetical protein
MNRGPRKARASVIPSDRSKRVACSVPGGSPRGTVPAVVALGGTAAGRRLASPFFTPAATAPGDSAKPDFFAEHRPAARAWLFIPRFPDGSFEYGIAAGASVADHRGLRSGWQPLLGPSHASMVSLQGGGSTPRRHRNSGRPWCVCRATGASGSGVACLVGKLCAAIAGSEPGAVAEWEGGLERSGLACTSHSGSLCHSQRMLSGPSGRA